MNLVYGASCIDLAATVNLIHCPLKERIDDPSKRATLNNLIHQPMQQNTTRTNTIPQLGQTQLLLNRSNACFGLKQMKLRMQTRNQTYIQVKIAIGETKELLAKSLVLVVSIICSES